MYLDRNDISFRKENEEEVTIKDKITVFRPGNRIYPQDRGYIKGEVIKARIIDVPWNDKEWKEPIFSNIVKLVKIETITVLQEEEIDNIDFKNSLKNIQTKEELLKHLECVYKKNNFNTITKIQMKKLSEENLINNNEEIKNLFTTWILKFAQLPEDNVTNIDELLSAKNFSLTYINHDYAGITPKMRNHIAQHYNLDIKNAMVVIQAEDFEKTLKILEKNKKYIGGWLGVGLKDYWWNIIKKKENGFINPVADQMESINFIAHFWEEIHWYNSDASWYTDSLCDKFKEKWSDIQNKNIVILWAGGTARGIALELANRWVNNIIILNRTVEKAEYIAKHLNNIKDWIAKAWTEDDIYTIQDQKIDAIINLSTKWADGAFEEYSWLISTKWGVKNNREETKKILQHLKKKNPDIIISDINLTKNKTTPLLETANSLDITTLDGKLMVIYQWTQAIRTVFGDKIIEAWGNKAEVQKKLIELIFKE